MIDTKWRLSELSINEFVKKIDDICPEYWDKIPMAGVLGKECYISLTKNGGGEKFYVPSSEGRNVPELSDCISPECLMKLIENYGKRVIYIPKGRHAENRIRQRIRDKLLEEGKSRGEIKRILGYKNLSAVTYRAKAIKPKKNIDLYQLDESVLSNVISMVGTYSCLKIFSPMALSRLFKAKQSRIAIPEFKCKNKNYTPKMIQIIGMEEYQKIGKEHHGKIIAIPTLHRVNNFLEGQRVDLEKKKAGQLDQ